MAKGLDVVEDKALFVIVIVFAAGGELNKVSAHRARQRSKGWRMGKLINRLKL